MAAAPVAVGTVAAAMAAAAATVVATGAAMAVGWAAALWGAVAKVKEEQVVATKAVVGAEVVLLAVAARWEAVKAVAVVDLDGRCLR